VSPFREAVCALARRIPRGKVATYGDLARLAGNPRGAREAGRAMAALPEGSDVPWWRVVNRHGEISRRREGMELQEELLRGEGVVFEAEGRVDMKRHGWDGVEGGGKSSRRGRTQQGA